MRAAASDGNQFRERVEDQRPEHDQEGEREQRQRADQHEPERLQPQQPPGPLLDQAVCAVEPDPQRLDRARGEVERQHRAEGEQPAARRRQDVLHLVAIGRATTSGHSAKISFAASFAELRRAEEAGHRRDEDQERKQRHEQRQADIAGDRPAVVGEQLLRRAPHDRRRPAQHLTPPAADRPSGGPSPAILPARRIERQPATLLFLSSTPKRRIATPRTRTHGAPQQLTNSVKEKRP